MESTLNLFRAGASLLANTLGVGFIDWLDGLRSITVKKVLFPKVSWGEHIA
jgi:hypothetical protein